jgi:hypothetical protein
LSKGDNERLADILLAGIRKKWAAIDKITEWANNDMREITERYEKHHVPLMADVKALEKQLITLMKKERGTFFDGTDVLQLENGALIHESADKVTIPRDALDKCKKLKFLDVIKIAESLDREAIEKWTTEKLLLIGAERKQTETFSYDLKKETHAE